MIEIVAATRHNQAGFLAETGLGQSLQRLNFDRRLSFQIACENQLGLPAVYNARIQASDGPDILVFMHDDVWIDDYWITERILEGLARFDVIGVAGNRRRLHRQPGWYWQAEGVPDEVQQLSGAVAHGAGPCGPVTTFGFSGAEVELLDGVFLAARKSRLRAAGVAFDPRFAFHFYDLDFCRTARAAQLRLGTWPIALTHQSGGRIDERWRDGLQRYREKWGEAA